MKKAISVSFLFFNIIIAVAQSQTMTTVKENDRYFLLVKYNVELVSHQNSYRLHEIKTTGAVREGDEKTQAWTDWKVLFRTQGEIKGTNFEVTTEPETGILNFGRTEDTKIFARKNGITGTTYGEYKQLSNTKNTYTNYVTTKHDIATNEGFNKDVECKEILSTIGEGSGTIRLAPTESYNIQMRLNPKKKRVEIRNWLPEAELSMEALQGGGSSGDASCTKNTIPSTDVSEFVTQYTLGLNELIKNSILYNSNEGVDENGREIPYKEITNLGEFMAFRLTNAKLNEMEVAQTGNRYVFSMILKDYYNDPIVNRPNNPGGSYYKQEFEGKDFSIRASITIAFQKKEITFDSYPGGELPPETDEPQLPWIPLMDKDDYPPKWFGDTSKNNNSAITNQKYRNVNFLTGRLNGDGFSNIAIVSKTNTNQTSTIYSDYNGEAHFNGNQQLPQTGITQLQFSIPADDSFLPRKVSMSPFGADTFIYFHKAAIPISINTKYRNVHVILKKADGTKISHKEILSSVGNELFFTKFTDEQGEADFIGNIALPRENVSVWTFTAGSVDGLTNDVIKIPAVGNDTTIVFVAENESSIRFRNVHVILKRADGTGIQSKEILSRVGNDNFSARFSDAQGEADFPGNLVLPSTGNITDWSITATGTDGLSVDRIYLSPFGEDTTLTFIQFPEQLNTTNYNVKGTVKYRSGASVVGQQIVLPNGAIATTNSSGQFLLTMPNGTYKLKARGCQPEQQTITIANTDVSVSFTKN